MIKFNKKNNFSLLIFAIVFIGIIAIFKLVLAATDIDSVNRWAWNDVIGWIDFYQTGNVNVYGDRLEGYTSSSVGYIALNCNSTPNGNICGGPAGNWKVANDGSGTLSGWAFNDSIGWISFNCSNTGSCASYNYSVTIDGNGVFNGWAWNDVIGWISFNCVNSGTNGCSSPGIDYKVKTSPTVGKQANLVSSTFDTGVANGVAFNSIFYQGTQPAGTSVKFQFASSVNSGGPWNYWGPDGTSSTYYAPSGPNIPAIITASQHNNKRYFRYKIFLESDTWQTATPVVDEITITWSL